MAGLGFLAVSTASDDGPTLCPFALVTGVACPGCGMTRAVSRLVRGDWAGAFAYHPLVFAVVAVAAVAAIWWFGSQRRAWPAVSTRTLNFSLALIGVVFLGVWLLRLSSGTLPVV